ncbi:MAG: hypothetical protein IH616_15950 [Gemmatimonadales bacterium]|nr:hypothetical protein [Gemmatimonadales bacterium]
MNELGDFLAGIAGPIALVWIVAGYLQQGQELRLQIEELRRSVEHQGELAKATEQQAIASKRQAETTTAALELERAKGVEAKMPKFVLECLRYEFSASSGTSYSANVRNDGASLGRIRIVENVTGMNVQHELNPGYWAKGVMHGLRWSLPDPQPPIRDWSFDIVFDAAGARYFQRIRLYRPEARQPADIDWSSDAIEPWLGT